MSTLSLNTNLDSIRSKWSDAIGDLNNSSELSNTSSENKLDFAKALSILSGESSSSTDQSVTIGSDLGDDSSITLLPANQSYSQSSYIGDGEDTEQKESRLQSLQDKFSVLNDNPVNKDWSALESQTTADDYSILDTIGDGLMNAAKIATKFYVGSLF